MSVKENDAFIVINDLLKTGTAVMKNKNSFIVPINEKEQFNHSKYY